MDCTPTAVAGCGSHQSSTVFERVWGPWGCVWQQVHADSKAMAAFCSPRASLCRQGVRKAMARVYCTVSVGQVPIALLALLGVCCVVFHIFSSLHDQRACPL